MFSQKGDKAATAPIQFGRYIVRSTLGQGAMATVHLAEDPALHRYVAIKVIHTHLANITNLLDRFSVEARTAALLRNPNIVEIFDYGLEGGAQFLVMEYVDGPNFQFLLNLMGGEPLDSKSCAAVICQAAEGLASAQKAQVVHRDIKPENMMFTSTGTLKIADFGIAHINEENLTQTGSILGSPNFMSPEQIDGSKPTHATDMFSLGAVFYYAFTGRRPFAGNNIPSIMRNICEAPHVPPLELNPQGDPELAALIDTLLQKKPEDRGDGARWLALTLRSYLNRQGVLDPTEASKEFLDAAGRRGGDKTLVERMPPSSVPPSAPLAPGQSRTGPDASPSASSLGDPGPVRTGSTWHPAPPEPQGTYWPGPGAPTPAGNGTQAAPPSQKWIFILGGLAVALVLILALIVLMKPSAPAPTPPVVVPAPKQEVSPPKPPEPTQIVANPPGLEMNVGDSRPLRLAVLPADADQALQAALTDSTVAEWADGQVRALSAGKTEIHFASQAAPTVMARVAVTVAAPATPAEPKTPKTPPPPPAAETPKGDPPPAASGPSATSLTIISAPPFAEVFLDGRFLGNTPLKNQSVPYGRHRLQVSHRRFKAMDTVINLRSKEQTLRFRLFGE